MSDQLIQSLELDGFLSFRPGSPVIPLTPLNVLIGPNGSGKSNLIEAIELLRATAGDLAATIRLGGSPAEWIWKGDVRSEAQVSAILAPPDVKRPLRYRLAFAEVAQRLEIVDEALEEVAPSPGHADPYFYYRFQRGRPTINTRVIPGSDTTGTQHVERLLNRETLNPQQSVLSQRKDPDLYPEITAVAQSFGAIQTFREWSFGRLSPPRLAQRADQSTAVLDADGRNLGLILNEIQHTAAWSQLKEYLRRFLPRFADLSTRVQSGSVQVYLHEEGLRSPVPASRLSDGTIRLIALLAILLRAETAPLICIEEPELGLHPDALDLVAELLVEAAGKSQVIATTHSDILVSALTDHADSVLVCEYLGGGTSVSRVESERLKLWLEDYRLGEIWRIGELGGNPVKGLVIYMEGGGDTSEGKARLRKGMTAFLGAVHDQARRRGLRLRIMACGSRNETFRKFHYAVTTNCDTLNLLLVDSEGPLTTCIREHLTRRDGWALAGVSDDALHLMVQLMESWLVADPDALSSYYRQGFRGKLLPAAGDLESVAKAQVTDALNEATKDTQKGPYHKIRHASDLLARIDPQKAQARCRHCKRLFDHLAAVLQGA